MYSKTKLNFKDISSYKCEWSSRMKKTFFSLCAAKYNDKFFEDHKEDPVITRVTLRMCDVSKALFIKFMGT